MNDKHDPKTGRFINKYGSSYSHKRRIQYSSSDERDDIEEDDEIEDKVIQRNNQIAKNEEVKKAVANEQEIQDKIKQLNYHADYLREKIAGAWDSDSREVYKKELRQCLADIKKLLKS